MKRTPALALFLAALAPLACAQFSAVHDGRFSNHSSSSFQSSFPSPGSALQSSFPSFIPRTFTGVRVPGTSPGFRGSGFNQEGGLGQRSDDRRHDRPSYGGLIPYYPYLGWNSPGIFYDTDSFAYQYMAPAPTPGDDRSGDPNTYQQRPPDQAQPSASYPQPYFKPSAPQSQPAPVPQMPAPAAEVEDPVTLIFKDGRPPEQIRNYAMTRTTLYVLNQHRRDIPLEQLDLPATRKVNQDAGSDFQLPALSH